MSDPLSGKDRSAKRRIPGANAFFPPQFLREDPIFYPISQQPTAGIFSTHANRLTKCQSIHWYCLLAFKMWAWCRTHHPEITHFSVPRELETLCCPQYLNSQAQEALLLT